MPEVKVAVLLPLSAHHEDIHLGLQQSDKTNSIDRTDCGDTCVCV